MCGICGIILPKHKVVSKPDIEKMNTAMMHRGPDGEGFFINGNVGLGHRRLSIIDLEGGTQPISNEDGSVIVVFNGEIYNYQELTESLIAQGHQFKTHSDTETLVHLYEQYGAGMLEQLRGMFAFAIHDRRTGTVFLARDRFGIKPLYYHIRGGALYFASEIKPIIEAGYSVEVNRSAIHLYLQSRFAHGDETIFKGIFRLAEGSYLVWRNGEWSVHRYYPTPDHESRDDGRDYDALFEEAFSSAVASHMVADVPVGAYLSGGVDSSAVVSEMVRLTGHPIRTFCVDFSGGKSEAGVAEDTAKALGCEHHTVLCGAEELLALPQVVKTLEEPVGDGVVVAQYFLSRATQQAGIKTVMTGDGADETLGGYQHLAAIIKAARWGRGPIGHLLSGVGAKVAERLPLGIVDMLAGLPLNVAEEARRRFAYLLRILPNGDLQEMYDLLLSLYCPDEMRDLYTTEFYAETKSMPVERFAGEPAGRTLADKVLSMQYRKWLPANINLKQDRLCMAHSVENRVPFLDHRFVELMTSFPPSVKIKGRRSKLLLRNLVAGRLKSAVSSAPKAPFHLPLEYLLADKRLWNMIEDNLDDARVRKRGFVRPEYARRVKELARGGDYMTAKKMFALVIIEMWFRIFVDGESL